jgi:alkylation response protein AidB-like acyl-CoA dehydrogenase
MDFGLDEAQEQLAASVRDVIEAEFSIPYVREMLEDPRGFSQSFWERAAELGWLGLLIDERYGGTGLGPFELVAVQHELGRGVVPGPLLASAVLAATALSRAGSPAQRESWLSRIAGGDCVASVAFPEAAGAGLPVKPVEARPTADGYRLEGEIRFVLDGHVADLIVVPAEGEDRGTTLFLVETRHPQVSMQPMQTIDPTRRLAELRLSGLEVPDDVILGEPDTGAAILERVADVGRLALCAEMVGGAERALEMCAEYARTREQFGRAIGSFQAIQHKCADMLLRVEGARAATLAAATSLASGGDDAPLDASIAKAWCSEAYRHVTTEGVQIHGGLGFTWDLDMQLYYKRAKSSEMLLGDARRSRERIASLALDAR